MAQVVITLTDTPTGGVAVHSTFQPAIGAPCSPAQSAALDILTRTKHDWGIQDPVQVVSVSAIHAIGEVDIDAVHRTRDNVVQGGVGV